MSETALNKTFGRLRVPKSRRLVSDVLNLHRQVPTCAHDRMIDLQSLAAVRDAVRGRISWPIIFIKAWATICSRHDVLRQSWRSFPMPHIYQHAATTAVVAVARRHQDADWLLWARLRNPQTQPLTALQESLDRFKNAPVESVFHQQLQFATLPGPLRRFIWWWNMNLAGEKRATRIGTFLLTTLAGNQTEIQHPPGFLASNLTYGPLSDSGRSRVTLAYDHRLMDGLFVAKRLRELEDELNDTIYGELRALADNQTRTAA